VTPTATAATTSTTTPDPSQTTQELAGVVPVGAPNTGAGGTSHSTDGPLIDLGALALLLAGASGIQLIRRRQQV